MKDIAILAGLFAVLASLATIWRLYFFHRPEKTQDEAELQRKSHTLSNEVAGFRSSIHRIKPHTDQLQRLVESMQQRQRHD